MAERPSPAASDGLFAGIDIRSPLAELEGVYGKRRRALESVETRAQAQRLDRTYQLARERLQAALAGEPLGTGEGSGSAGDEKGREDTDPGGERERPC